VSTTYAYDEAGQRVSKTSGSNVTLYFGPEVESVNGAMTQYYYAGTILVAQKAGATPSTSTSATTTWYHADRLGSIRLMTDGSGAPIASYDYQPFGGIQSQTGAVRNERGYTGHFMDGESGLIYMNARYEDPVLGRFVTADDYTGAVTTPQDLNAYSYAGNSPLNNTDPTGRRTLFVGDSYADSGQLPFVAPPLPFVAPPPPPPDTFTPQPRDSFTRAGGNQIPAEPGTPWPVVPPNAPAGTDLPRLDISSCGSVAPISGGHFKALPILEGSGVVIETFPIDESGRVIGDVFPIEEGGGVVIEVFPIDESGRVSHVCSSNGDKGPQDPSETSQDKDKKIVDGYDPADFGADNIVKKPNQFGGWHYTAWARQAGQISWDVDANGQYVDKTGHMSGRNIPGGGDNGYWPV
jgi:RHS repeat-associated protein